MAHGRNGVDGGTEKHNVVSLFSGAMGLDLGLARTGRFCHLACVEMDPAACETIRLNTDAGRIDPGRLYQADIERLDPRCVMRDLGLRPGELDLLVGGPPCQSLSLAGRRRGVQDVRGLMLWQYLWFVEAMRPKCWVLENVRGFMSAALRPARGRAPSCGDERQGSLFERFVADIPDDYRLDVFEVNAANHGCPQARERVLVFANRYGRTTEFPAPTHGPGLSPYRTLRDALEGLVDPHPVVLDFTRRRKRYLDMVPPGGNWRDLPPDIAREAMARAYRGRGGRAGFYHRLSWDLPCPAVTTAPNQIMTCLCHPDQTRALSLAECAAVQGFPANWDFRGSVVEMYRQVGNAVPVGLGQVAGEVAARLLDEVHAEGMGEEGHPRCRVVNVRSTVRFGRHRRAVAGR